MGEAKSISPVSFYEARVSEWQGKYRQAVADGDDKAMRFAAQEMRNYKEMLRLAVGGKNHVG